MFFDSVLGGDFQIFLKKRGVEETKMLKRVLEVVWFFSKKQIFYSKLSYNGKPLNEWFFPMGEAMNGFAAGGTSCDDAAWRCSP